MEATLSVSVLGDVVSRVLYLLPGLPFYSSKEGPRVHV